jgi:hypothetical protein
MTKRLMLGILPLGIVPGLLNLPWAWVVIVFWLWCVVDPSRWNEQLNKLSVILMYLYTVFCCWVIIQTYGSSYIIAYQNYAMGLGLFFLLAYWVNLVINNHWFAIWHRSPFIISLTIISVFLYLMHMGLCSWAGLFFEQQRWNTYSITFLILFVSLFPFYHAYPLEKIPNQLKPLLVILTVALLFGHYVKSQQLLNLANVSSQYRNAVTSAVQSGYNNVVIYAALQEGEKLSAQQKTHEAVTYLRSQWEHIPKEQMAEAYRSHPKLKYNPLLFLTLFGGKLKLHEGEEIQTGLLMQNPLQYLIVTNQKRILQITPNGIHAFPSMFDDLQKLHYQDSTNTLYAISRNADVIIQQQDKISTVQLPPGQRWVDIALSATGETYWALQSRGGIVEYTKQNGAWNFSRELYPPLWQETELAIRLLHEVIDEYDVFYVLDQCKGISARNPMTINNQVLPKDDLYHFFNPERRTAVDFQRYEDTFIITDEFGQLDTVKKGVGNDNTDWKYSIRGAIHFDRNSGMWLRQDDTTALIANPEANTLIQLKRNGVFEPIAMPQGFRLVPLKRNGWWDASSQK